MNSKKSYKAGLFVLAVLILLGYMILNVGKGVMPWHSSLNLTVNVNSAAGIDHNTPVKIAGVDVGTVADITLTEFSTAQLHLRLNSNIQISSTAVAHIRSTGILGDSYVEISQDHVAPPFLKSGDSLGTISAGSDISSVTGQMGDIANDVKEITKQLRKSIAGDNSPFDKSIKNIAKITDAMARLTLRNEQNINVIISNLKDVTRNMNALIQRNSDGVTSSISNVNDITGSIARGEGTIGKLVKDDTTIQKLNESLDGLNDFLGGPRRLKVNMGLHTEYLGSTKSFKNYVALNLQPRPDKAFLFEVTSDPDPSFSTRVEQTTVTSGSTTSTIDTERKTKTLNQFLISAELAKRFEDFTLRGGLIEGTGGVGIDYNRGLFGLKFSAFDFKTDSSQKPHLKLMGTTQITDAFYLLAGLDDFINPNQDLDWFVGAGVRFDDDDIKSLLGIMSLSGK